MATHNNEIVNLFGCVCQPTINEYDDDDDELFLTYDISTVKMSSYASRNGYAASDSARISQRECVIGYNFAHLNILVHAR